MAQPSGVGIGVCVGARRVHMQGPQPPHVPVGQAAAVTPAKERSQRQNNTPPVCAPPAGRHGAPCLRPLGAKPPARQRCRWLRMRCPRKCPVGGWEWVGRVGGWVGGVGGVGAAPRASSAAADRLWHLPVTEHVASRPRMRISRLRAGGLTVKPARLAGGAPFLWRSGERPPAPPRWTPASTQTTCSVTKSHNRNRGDAGGARRGWLRTVP